MATIFHAADLHIGARFTFLSEEQAKQAICRQMTAFREFLDKASESGADAVLIAGDLFDSPTVSASVSRAVFALLESCTAPVFISPGNHDYYSGKSPYAGQLPSNVTVFTKRTLTSVPLADGSTVIWGAAFQDTKASISLKAPIDPSKINICLMHGELGGDSGYNAVSESEVLESGFDYIALGHNHRFSGVFRFGSSTLCCPGCFSPTSSAETGVKGWLSGKVEKGSAVMDFYQANVVRFEEVTVQMSSLRSNTQLLENLLPRLAPEPSLVYCTIRFQGTRSFEPQTDILEKSLRMTFFSVDIVDESVPLGDIYRYEKDDTLQGMVTRDMKAKIDGARSEVERAKLTLALEYALAAMEGRNMSMEARG